MDQNGQSIKYFKSLSIDLYETRTHTKNDLQVQSHKTACKIHIILCFSCNSNAMFDTLSII